MIKAIEMKKLLFIIALCNVSFYSLYCQNKTIKGRIIDERLESMPMASILNVNNVEVGKTDMNGFFQIEIPVSDNKLSFSFVGMELLTIELKDQCDEIEAIMMFDVIYDFITLKKIDKLRMKRFKKLPMIHEAAFEKGIFKTDKACYFQEFIAYKKQ